MPIPRTAETLLLEGTDAIAFAQAQFSSQVHSLTRGQWQFSAWLDPQGRVRALFHLARLADDRLLLLLRGGNASAVVAALRPFVFRSKVTLTALPPRVLVGGPAQPMHAVYGEAETLALGCGTHSMHIASAGDAGTAWHLLQLREGWPWLPTQALNELLPPALSLHRLGAVAVDKGCYPGQEIVARLHYRGGHKRRLHRVTLSHAASAGEALQEDEKEAGRLLDVITTNTDIEALVVLNDDVVTAIRDGRPNTFNDHLTIRLITSWTA